MSTANQTQVGGDHYKVSEGLQHWDVVAILGLDYFQGNITKYITRWKKKGGLQDLKKALHYTQKYVELVEQGIIQPDTPPEEVAQTMNKHGITVED